MAAGLAESRRQVCLSAEAPDASPGHKALVLSGRAHGSRHAGSLFERQSCAFKWLSCVHGDCVRVWSSVPAGDQADCKSVQPRACLECALLVWGTQCSYIACLPADRLGGNAPHADFVTSAATLPVCLQVGLAAGLLILLL